MARFEKVINYINNVKIKKTIFGGYDREDVYMKMNEIVDIFKEYMKDEREEQEAQRKEIEEELREQKRKIEEYKIQLQSSQALIEELNKKLSTLAVEKMNTEKEKEKMKEVYKGYCANIMQQYSDSLHTLSSEFANALDNIAKLQQSIVDMEKFENLEELELGIEAVEEKENFELPDLDLDIDEWLHGDEKKDKL